MTERSEKANNLHNEGYNCAQAVLLAFEDLFDLDRETLAAISSSFGGGMGKQREVCGAVSGMNMVAGLLYGRYPAADKAAKNTHYELIAALDGIFKADNGSLLCRDLLGLTLPKEERPVKKPCGDLIVQCTEIMEHYLDEHPVEKG